MAPDSLACVLLRSLACFSSSQGSTDVTGTERLDDDDDDDVLAQTTAAMAIGVVVVINEYCSGRRSIADFEFDFCFER